MLDAPLELAALYLATASKDCIAESLRGRALEAAAICVTEYNNALYARYQGACYSQLPWAQVQAWREGNVLWTADPEQAQ